MLKKTIGLLCASLLLLSSVNGPALSAGDKGPAGYDNAYEYSIANAQAVQSDIAGSTDSSNANLSSITFSDGMLTPAFDPNVTSYTLNVEYSVSTVQLTVGKEDPGSTVRIRGVVGTSLSIPFLYSDIPVIIEVTAANGTTIKIYTLTLHPYSSGMLAKNVVNMYVYNKDCSGADVTVFIDSMTVTSVTVTHDGAPIAWPIDNTFTLEGKYIIYSTRSDGLLGDTYTFTIDKTPPVITAKTAAGAPIEDGEDVCGVVFVTIADSNVESIDVYRDGNKYEWPADGKFSPIGSGYTLYTIRAWDASGQNTFFYFKVKPYTVHFDAQGGSAVADKTAQHNATITAPATPTRTGYTFGGWYKQAACDTAWNFATDKVDANITLYAKWIINSYTVTFNSQGGTGIAGKTTNYNTVITAPAAPTRTGYTFGGWYKQAACTTAWNFAMDNVTANTTLYAKWTPNRYTVTFNSQGGTTVASKTANYDTTITAPTASTRTGYTFGGWYKQAACTTAWNFTTDKVTANITLYAKWIINSYTVTFNSQGGTAVASKTTNYNTVITAPAALTRTGYTFGGWYKQTACTTAWNFATDKVTANTTLYAKWTPNTYTVTFNSQGGTAVASKKANYNTTITTPAAPTRTGYTFGGWYKQEACTTAWNPATDKVTANITLYAKWNLIRYTIAASPNNTSYGSITGGGSIVYGASVTLRATPKAGYRFVRWLEGAIAVSTATEYKFTATKNRTLKGEFAKIGTPAVTTASSGYSSVNLTWTAVPGAKEYEIYRAGSRSGAYSQIGATTATSYSNTGLTAGTTYYYKVRAKCVAGSTITYGIASDAISARPIPPTPASVKAASASYSSVKLTWNAVAGATGYAVYRATSSTGTYTKQPETTSTSFTSTGLTAGKTYYYKVRACRLVGSTMVYGNYSSLVSATPVPATPTGVKVARGSSTSIKLSWGTVLGATMYEVYRASSSTGAYTKLIETDSTSYTNIRLTTGRTYYYKVRAYRLVGSTKVYGLASSAVSMKP